MTRQGLPKRQRLVGVWLLLSGVSLVGGALFAAWLDSQLALSGVARAALWLGSFSGGITLFLMGLLLERMAAIPAASRSSTVSTARPASLEKKGKENVGYCGLWHRPSPSP